MLPPCAWIRTPVSSVQFAPETIHWFTDEAAPRITWRRQQLNNKQRISIVCIVMIFQVSKKSFALMMQYDGIESSRKDNLRWDSIASTYVGCSASLGERRAPISADSHEEGYCIYIIDVVTYPRHSTTIWIGCHSRCFISWCTFRVISGSGVTMELKCASRSRQSLSAVFRIPME